jgi:hypothetical protein
MIDGRTAHSRRTRELRFESLERRELLSISRPADPLVVTGADVPDLAGLAPEDLVAFRYDDGWQQIPVQVDERDMIRWEQVYNYLGSSELENEFYTDPGTYAGPDSDPTLDANDEIVVMLGDAGEHAAALSEPAGVIAGSGVELTITDPLTYEEGYIYLFQQDGSLDPAAGQQYVDYTFDLLAGDYLDTYDLSASGYQPPASSMWITRSTSSPATTSTLMT